MTLVVQLPNLDPKIIPDQFVVGDLVVLGSLYLAKYQGNGVWVNVYDYNPLSPESVTSYFKEGDVIFVNHLIPQREETLPLYCKEILPQLKDHIAINTNIWLNFSNLNFFSQEFYPGIKFRIPVNTLELCAGAYLLKNCSAASSYMLATENLESNIHLIKKNEIIGIILLEELAHWIVQGMPLKSSYTFVLKSDNKKDYSLAKKVADFFLKNTECSQQFKNKVLALNPNLLD